MDNHTQAVVPKLNNQAIRAFILNHLSSANLLAAPEALQNAPDHTFPTNGEFWQAVLSYNAPPLSWIELPSYQVCDWLPRSPGLFHTSDAQWQRQRAKRHLVDEDGVLHYKPEGKSDMIAGGIGSVRFQPIQKASAEEVARDLESLTSEATSSKPRKKWWQMSIDGIKSAAENVAGIGKPVLEILAKLKPLLIAAS